MRSGNALCHARCIAASQGGRAAYHVGVGRSVGLLQVLVIIMFLTEGRTLNMSTFAVEVWSYTHALISVCKWLQHTVNGVRCVSAKIQFAQQRRQTSVYLLTCAYTVLQRSSLLSKLRELREDDDIVTRSENVLSWWLTIWTRIDELEAYLLYSAAAAADGGGSACHTSTSCSLLTQMVRTCCLVRTVLLHSWSTATAFRLCLFQAVYAPSAKSVQRLLRGINGEDGAVKRRC